MKCTVVKQLPNHCVPACIESIAKDNGINISQTQIVSQYPEVFPDSGGLNDVGKQINLKTLFQDLGLAEDIYKIHYDGVARLKKLCDKCEILLFWTKISKHCVRLIEFNEDDTSIIIMDPEYNELQKRNIAWLNEISPDLIYFEKQLLMKNTRYINEESKNQQF